MSWPRIELCSHDCKNEFRIVNIFCSIRSSSHFIRLIILKVKNSDEEPNLLRNSFSASALSSSPFVGRFQVTIDQENQKHCYNRIGNADSIQEFPVKLTLKTQSIEFFSVMEEIKTGK